MALNSQSFSVPFHLNAAIESALGRWRSEDRLHRLWQRDASLWTGSDEADWLGWLDAPAEQLKVGYESISADIRAAGFTDVLLLGMGGSVLCPALFGQVFGPQPGFPGLRVLDSLDPVDIRAAEASVDLSRTLVVVSSKSGSTLETRLLTDYFVERMAQAVGRERCGRHLAAITDPGSALEHSARESGFRHVFEGRADIGGRFSAFSSFGLVPLALLGVDVRRFIADTMSMVEASGPDQNALGSPGVLLGVIMGVLARHGHNKITLVAPRSITSLADWLEQLLAESTGKSGVGLLPVTREELRAPDAYGADRLFVYLKPDRPFPNDDDRAQDVEEPAVTALEEAGHAVVRIGIRDVFSIGQELFRWEVATSVAGSELGVHPFDQPDVEASKRATRDLMAGYEQSGRFEEEVPTIEDETIRVFWRPGAARRHETAGGGMPDCIRSFVSALGGPDYCAVLAYAPEDPASQASLDRLRAALVQATEATITVSHGPRYLHSSGQLHKGGPDNGAFLVLVAGSTDDIPVPGHRYSFGVVKSAQARGDSEILSERGRSVLRVEIEGPLDVAVSRIVAALSDVRPSGGPQASPPS